MSEHVEIPDALKQPLVFGNADQIYALKKLAMKKFWATLENCPECDGEGECSQCHHVCDACDGQGKTTVAIQRFEKEFGCSHPWR